MALESASFMVADAATLPPDPPFDVITAFDAVHDQRSPETVVARAHDALAADGAFVMVDARVSTLVQDNVGNPHVAPCCGISLLYCLPASLAEGGAGLGAMWGRKTALDMLAGASPSGEVPAGAYPGWRGIGNGESRMAIVVLHWFAGTAEGYRPWVVSHPAEFVVSVTPLVRRADLRTGADGQPVMHADRPLRLVLHRATCRVIQEAAGDESRICGPGAELRGSFAGEELRRCPSCE